MDANRDRLMAIIKTQSEIAASDLDTNQVMHLVANRAQDITGATSAVIELPEGQEMVYAVTAGEATPYLNIRMDRRSSLSGLSLDSGKVLYCEDTEIAPPRRPPGLEEGQPPLDDLRAAQAPGPVGGRAQGLLPRAAALRPHGRRDPDIAERGDLGTDGPRI